jgi:hypothetical protein
MYTGCYEREIPSRLVYSAPLRAESSEQRRAKLMLFASKRASLHIDVYLLADCFSMETLKAHILATYYSMLLLPAIRESEEGAQLLDRILTETRSGDLLRHDIIRAITPNMLSECGLDGKLAKVVEKHEPLVLVSWQAARAHLDAETQPVSQ